MIIKSITAHLGKFIESGDKSGYEKTIGLLKSNFTHSYLRPDTLGFPAFENTLMCHNLPFDCEFDVSDYMEHRNVFPMTPFKIIDQLAPPFIDNVSVSSDPKTNRVVVNFNPSADHLWDSYSSKYPDANCFTVYLISSRLDTPNVHQFPPGFATYSNNHIIFRQQQDPLIVKLSPSRDPCHIPINIRFSYQRDSNVRWKFQLIVGIDKDAMEKALSIDLKIPKDETLRMISKLTSGDDDLLMESTVLSLRCPWTFFRLGNPVKGVDCTHVQCFDAISAFKVSDKAVNCPICHTYLPVEKLAIDEWTRDLLQRCPPHINEILLKFDGSWEEIEDNCAVNIMENASSDQLPTIIDLTSIEEDPNEPLPEHWERVIVKQEREHSPVKPVIGNPSPLQIINISTSENEEDSDEGYGLQEDSFFRLLEEVDSAYYESIQEDFIRRTRNYGDNALNYFEEQLLNQRDVGYLNANRNYYRNNNSITPPNSGKRHKNQGVGTFESPIVL